MKVALFTDCFDQINGISNTLQYFAQYCQTSNRKLDVFTHSDRNYGIEDRGSVRILRYPCRIPIRYYSDMAFDLLCLRRSILQEADRQNYSLIHLTTGGSMGLNGLNLACARKLPRVGSYHTALPEFLNARIKMFLPFGENFCERCSNLATRFAWVYEKWFYGKCQLVLAPSYSVLNDLSLRLENPIHIFSRGIDTERFHPRFRRPGDRQTILYAGRLAVEKNLDVLVELMSARKNLRMVFVGDGPSRKQLERALPNAVFTGFLKGAALSEAYASADVFITPSTTDTFGNVILEAMSSGLPVLVSDRMGPKELVAQGTNGFICRDAGEFGVYLDMLTKRDEQTRKRMGIAARQFAEGRSWSAVFDQLFESYEYVCSQKAIEKLGERPPQQTQMAPIS
jgi:glycosyltransferase involved in cell wall biosynthesis